MNLVPGETSLVVAGAWNPAILTPPWVLQHGLRQHGDSGNVVQALIPAAAGLLFESPTFKLRDLFSYSVRGDALLVMPSGVAPGQLQLAESAVASMLEQLQHTPLGGVGHNFEFREPAPVQDVLGVFTSARQDVAERMPAGWEATSSVVSASFRSEASNVVMTVLRQFDGSNIIVKFNFHHPITSVDGALAVLRGTNGYATMAANLEIARTLMTALYGVLQNE